MNNQNSYTESLKLTVTIDKAELQRIQQDFDKLHIGGLKKEDAESLKKAYTDHQAKLEQIRKIEQDIQKLRGIQTKEAKQAIKDLEEAKKKLEGNEGGGQSRMSKVAGDFKTMMIQKGTEVLHNIENNVKQFMSDIKQRAFDMMDEMASYSANSRIFSQEATNLKLNYGLSGAQAYAAQMASQQTGFGSFDSYLENQWFATKEQREEWQKLYKQYEKSYEQDEKVALEFQAFKRDWTNLKNELAQEVIHFFMENKQVIKESAKAIIEISKAVVKFFSWYVSNFGSGLSTNEERTARTNDIIAGYAQNTNNSNISVNQTNNYNVDNATARSVTEANNNDYRQLIAQLTAG